ncbi:helix-turn-helix domain-containing protein [Amycolatopsis cihanbeyliensis]|uniref:Transcriptional regulator with XRE-family HTH domain n=1 Tax=Amycolatopsis cihanbeyliensis TaxID=1128664 RepID=A0A542DR44_AMYCI|nr:helix-turn-helix domain-containing protein [Amycolatopsis cihanbeyliensis]TQJ05435.1 transcriptional regulator with XRE-family HTH domain [Amycolatopsis cihanbeyliensis]
MATLVVHLFAEERPGRRAGAREEGDSAKRLLVPARSHGEPTEIGQRVRAIRRRRGLSLDTAAGLAGISKAYLSLLERGERRFERRGLLEDLANALGCAVIDLTGQPYLPGDRVSAEALATLPPISVALYDATLEDVPDVPARPVEQLARLARVSNEHSANSLYSLAGYDLGDLLTELHVHAVTGEPDTRRAALAALVEACFVAAGNARSLGNYDLAVTAARRAQDAARRLDDPALSAFAAMTGTGALSRLGARHRAQRVASTALAEVEYVDPEAKYTGPAEAAGMLHLSSAQMAAKDHDADRAATHLQAAAELAERTGERNALQFTFGPANVQAWSLSVAVELGQGTERAETIARTPGYDANLVTADRKAALHFDLARAYAQAEGARDGDAVRHLDLADRIAPQRIRHDPVSRELLAELDTRVKRRSWELESLKHRLTGVDSL